MRVTYIKMQFVEEKYEELFDDMISDLSKIMPGILKVKNSFSIESGLYFVYSSDETSMNLGYTEVIFFCEDYVLKLIKDKIEKYLTIYEILDITKPVKFETFDNDLFTKSFKTDDIYSIYQLETYLDRYTTCDDILDKINECGFDSLTEYDKLFLQ